MGVEDVDEIVGYEEPGSEVDRLAYAVIGAAIEVHRELGARHAESVYEKALAREMTLRGIPFVSQAVFDLAYKGVIVGQGRLDFLVGGILIVEIKAVETLASAHIAQTIGYLKATRHRLALLINFNVSRLKDGMRRIALTSK